MRKIRIAQLLILIASGIFLSAFPSGASGGGFEALKRFNDNLCDNNAEIQFLKAELSSFELEARAASKRSPVLLEIEGERSLESGAEKKIQAKNIAFSKSFGINDRSGLIKRKNSLELKIKYEQTRKAVEDIIYDSYAALINARKMIYQKKLAGVNLKIAENISAAVTQKYEVALGSKMEIEQAALDYEVQFLKLIEITNGLKIQKASLEIKNGVEENGLYNNIFESFLNSELTSEVELLLKTADTPLPGAGVFYDAAVNLRRDLKAVSYEIELIAAAIESQKRSGSPEFSFGIFRSINDLSEAERGVKLSVSIPVYDFGRRGDSLKALRLKLSGYRCAEGVKSFLLEHTKRTILLDITEKYNLCLFNREKLIRLSNSAFQKAASLLNMAAIGYAEGATTLLEYQSAKKSYFEFYEQLISAALDFDLSLLELRRACGMAPDENYDIMKRFIQL
jgi:outer membrane protein TolC